MTVTRASSASKSVLVVEDDPDIRETLIGLLGGDGYEVSASSNGLEALEHLRLGHLPDVILLDLMMPTLDGWEFRVEQKRDPRLASIPVIALSADGTAKAAAIDADGYLSKPVDYGQLVGAIERTILGAERRRLQATLVETEKAASLGTLAAGLAHEINNPLTYVMANLNDVARSLEGGAFESQRLREAVGEASEGCRRIRNLVSDLLLFSRTQHDSENEVDVRRVLDSSANILMHEIRTRARLARDYGEVPPVLAEEAALARVFLNLVLNAAQAIVPGNPTKNEIRMTARAEGDGVIVEVRDTGVGIAPDVRPKVFDPFFTTKPLGVGTGLGLSIAHRLVVSMGGELTFESEQGRGSTFRVKLPRGERPARASVPRTLAAERAGRARLLVIDDEPTIAAMLARLLSRAHDVEGTTNPDEAVQRIKRGERFSLILCDLMMPGRSGIEVLAAIRAFAPEQAERMLFMTGGAVDRDANAFVEDQGDKVIYKPFTADEVLTRIGAALATFEARERAAS